MQAPDWVQHCEDENCSLGRFVYTCPLCGRDCDNYGEAWSEKDDVFEGKAVAFECESCKGRLEVRMLNLNVIVRPKEPAVSDKKYPVCPQTEGVFEGKNAEVFLMAVVHVPGRVPVIVTTPRFCKEVPADASVCDVCSLVGELVDTTVIKGAVDIAAEIRDKFKPKEPPCQTDPSTQTPASSSSGEPSTSSACPKPTSCENCGNSS